MICMQVKTVRHAVSSKDTDGTPPRHFNLTSTKCSSRFSMTNTPLKEMILKSSQEYYRRTFPGVVHITIYSDWMLWSPVICLNAEAAQQQTARDCTQL